MQGNATRSVAPVSEVDVMAHSAGHGTSMAFWVKALVDRDTGTPSFTSAIAARRVAGVIRLSVPSSSSLPQRPQLDNSVCQASNCAPVTTGRDDDCWEAASPESAAAMPMEQTRIETAVRIAVLMMPPGCRTALLRREVRETTAEGNGGDRSAGEESLEKSHWRPSGCSRGYRRSRRCRPRPSISFCGDVLRFTSACQPALEFPRTL